MKRIESLQSKILSGIDLERWLTIIKFKDQKIVFTSGGFDVLHKGHIHHLAEASEMGDYLVIGLNTDALVKKQLGNNRPFLDQESRALLLASMQFVSVIVMMDEDNLPDLIRQIRPDTLVNGQDHIPEEFTEHDFVRNYGGEVITLNSLEGYSGTDIINRITAG